MAFNFELAAGPFKGRAGGLAWDGNSMLVAAVLEERIYRFDPLSGKLSDFRQYTGRTNGIAAGPNGSVFGAQEGGRRVIEFKADGSTAPTNDLLDGQHHNQPTDVAVDGKGRVWFADAFNTLPPYGPPAYPFPEHASILRLEGATGKWTLRRVTHDTLAVRALALSPDEKTLYVAEGDVDRAGRRELRAYPVQGDGSVGKAKVLHDFITGGRGIEGLCVAADGSLIAVGGSAKSPAGAFIYVFSPSGELKDRQKAPEDVPARCAFGDADLDSLYVTTEGGHLFRAKASGLKGVKR